MESGNPTSTTIPRVDGLSIDTPVLGRHIASVGITLLGVAHTLYGKIFQVRVIRRWTALIRGCKGEERQHVAFIINFEIFLEQTSFDMYLYIKEL